MKSMTIGLATVAALSLAACDAPAGEPAEQEEMMTEGTTVIEGEPEEVIPQTADAPMAQEAMADDGETADETQQDEDGY